MHIPKYYREEDKTKIIEFIKSNGFPALVSHDGEKLVATHLPVEVIQNPDDSLTILSHMSRANPQWKRFVGKNFPPDEPDNKDAEMEGKK